MVLSYSCLGAAAAYLASASAFVPQEAFHTRPNAVDTTRQPSFAIASPAFPSFKLFSTTDNVLSEDQTLHTAERLSGMSRGEIQHIFEDLDADGSGTIDIAELDLLAKYFPGESFSPDLRKKLLTEIDTDGSGDIDSEGKFMPFCLVTHKTFVQFNADLLYKIAM